MPGPSLIGLTGQPSLIPLLKMNDNGPATGVLRTVTDGLGNDTALQVSNLGMASAGTLAVAGVATFTGTPTGAGLTALFASPPAIGSTAPSTGAFTTLAASGVTVGAGGVTVTGGAVSASGQGSKLGAAAGSSASPTESNTNLLLYDNSSTSWAGIGIDGSGNMYFALGTAGVVTRLKLDTGGGCTVAGAFGCNGKAPQTPVASGGVLANVVAALIANGILSS